MQRYKLTVEYDGTPYYGWQRQNDLPSVQEELEKAIKNFCGVHCPVQCSGRTDAGVHARGQVVHVDLPRNYDTYTVMMAINNHIIRLAKQAPSISVISVMLVDSGFNARFDAKKRYYQYRIINRKSILVLEQNRAWQVPVPLDHHLMHEAAQYLIGKHDFTSFRAAACQANSPIKTIDNITIKRFDDNIIIDINALSFLHHQVRNIVGTLKWVGEQTITPEYINNILQSCNRSNAGPTAPAAGLYFMKVEY